MLVMMADQVRISAGDLFMGAMMPGLLLGTLYIVYIVIYSFWKPDAAPVPADCESLSWQLMFSTLVSIIPTATLIFAVLGSIFFGIATPTEASGIGALGATLLAYGRGKISLASLREVSISTTQTTAYIFALFVGATAFSLILRGLGGDELIEDALTSLPFGTSGIILCILFGAFILGFFLDWIEITLILLPLVAPVMLDLGIDLVWFTVMFAVCLQTSFITPPVGFALFYMKGVIPAGISMTTIYKGIIPFVLIQMLTVLILLNFPRIVTWLPSVAY
jgi:tripartite ATP-independent transporter DctM subunit